MTLLKKNKTLLLGIIIGLILSVTGVYAATILFQGSRVGFDNTIAGLTKQNGDPVETVQEALEAINRKVPISTCTTSPFQLGDYIDMTPTSTSFTPDRTLTGLDDYDNFYSNSTAVAGTLNPSYLNVWRVIKINSDCTVEVVSEYVSNVGVKFASKVGYQNYIYYLNEIAKKYANTTYTLDPSTAPDGAFRNVGYDGQTKQITDTTRLDDGTLGTSSGRWYFKDTLLNGEESLGGGDQKYITDLKLLDDVGVSLVAYTKGSTVGTTTSTYWLASRYYQCTNGSSPEWTFRGRYMSYDGIVPYYGAFFWGHEVYRNNPIFKAGYDSYAVRPIVTLKSGLTTSSGNGTASSHYQLSAS